MRFTVTPVNEADLNTQTNDEVIEMSVLDGDNRDDQNNNSGSDSDERNNELLVFPLSPNSYVAANDVDDDTNFNYDGMLLI